MTVEVYFYNFKRKLNVLMWFYMVCYTHLIAIHVNFQPHFSFKLLVLMYIHQTFRTKHTDLWQRPVSYVAYYPQGLRGMILENNFVMSLGMCQKYDSQTDSISICCHRWQKTSPIGFDNPALQFQQFSLLIC